MSSMDDSKPEGWKNKEALHRAEQEDAVERQRIEEEMAAQRAHDRRPLGSRFQDTCRQTREGGGLPEGSVVPAGITHDLVLQLDPQARRMEREERLLAFNGGDVNKTLLDACHEGGEKDARFLLAHGADVNHISACGRRALSRAALYGHAALVQMLLDAGAIDPHHAFTRAAGAGRTAVVAMLLDRGVESDGNHAQYALRFAAGNDRLETVTLLLDRGTNPNNYNYLGLESSALKDARDSGHYRIAALLLARGAIDYGAA